MQNSNVDAQLTTSSDVPAHPVLFKFGCVLSLHWSCTKTVFLIAPIRCNQIPACNLVVILMCRTFCSGCVYQHAVPFWWVPSMSRLAISLQVHARVAIWTRNPAWDPCHAAFSHHTVTGNQNTLNLLPILVETAASLSNPDTFFSSKRMSLPIRWVALVLQVYEEDAIWSRHLAWECVRSLSCSLLPSQTYCQQRQGDAQQHAAGRYFRQKPRVQFGHFCH